MKNFKETVTVNERSDYKELMRVVLDNSYSQDWLIAKTEWDCVYVVEGESSHCVCGHHIIYHCHIKNRITNNKLIVGTTCVNKFGEKDLDEFVDTEKGKIITEKNRLKKEIEANKKKAEIEAKRELEYTLLKERQAKNNIPISVRLKFLNKMVDSCVINEFEFNFYNNIMRFDDLSDKQKSLKQKLNDRMLDYYNKNKV